MRFSAVAFFALALILPEASSAAARANFLIILADDCTFSDLTIYGGANAHTPSIDRLAADGMVFNRAYLSEAMCQPCRSELYSGQYPMRNGCAWNHSASRPSTTSMPQHLGALGYRVGIAGKIHVTPKKAFPFEIIGGFEPNCVHDPTMPHDAGPIREFMAKNPAQPFCLVVALVDPHVPWVMGDPSQYPANKIALPPNLADTRRTREDFGRYLAEITYMDAQVGDILATLEQAGHSSDTLVLFSSEQGAQFPGCKWTNWDTGLHTALIARWPGKIAPGTRTEALVQYADVLPTLLEAARGDPAPPECDGSSFLPVLIGTKSGHRQFVYGVHNNIPEGPPYPIRSVCDGRFRYIRNLTSGEIYIEKHIMGVSGNGSLNNPYWPTWVWDASNSPHTYNLVKRYTRRPPEELYETTKDPFEMTNLAQDPAYAETKSRLGAELDRWLASQGDPGAPEDSDGAIEAARKGRHIYFPPERNDRRNRNP